MEMILSDLNKFEKLSIKKRILNFPINHEKILTIIWRDLRNQEICLGNNVTKSKQSEGDQEFYMDVVKYKKSLLMFVHQVDLDLLQLVLLVTNLLNF